MITKLKIILTVSLCILSASWLPGCGGGGDDPINATSNETPTIPNNQATISISASTTSERPGIAVSFDIIATNYVSIQCDFDGDGSVDINATDTIGPFSYSYQTTSTYTASCQAINNGSIFTNSNTISIDIAYRTGDIVKTLSFPAGINNVADVAYDQASDTLWLLGFSDSSCNGNALVNIDAATGSVISEIPLVNPSFFLNCASEITIANGHFYTTSYGWSNGNPQQFIYELDTSGNTTATFPCPAVSAGGFCEGLTWDGTHLWSGSSDNKNLTRFSISGVVDRTLYDVLETVNLDDLDYDSAKNQLVVLKPDTGRSVYKINPSTGTVIAEFINSGSVFTGAWNSPNWISVYSPGLIINYVHISDL